MKITTNLISYVFYFHQQHSTRMKTRNVHSTCQIIGSSFLGLGMIFIFSHKAEIGKSLFPETLHSYIGTFCFFIIIIQIFSGFEKVENLQRTNTKSRRWHGDLGALLWDCLILALLTGICKTVDYDNLFSLIAEISIIIVWVIVHIQIKKKEEVRTVDDEISSQTSVSMLRSSSNSVEDANSSNILTRNE